MWRAPATRRRDCIAEKRGESTYLESGSIQKRLVMPREGGASSNDGLAITGSPAFAGDDG
jgi:hypothetical protein